MLKKLKQILATWREINDIRIPVSVEEWGEMDARSMAVFLGSPAGRKYLSLLQKECDIFAQNAVFKAANSDPRYACGVAAGMQAMLRWTQSLSANPEPQTGESDDAEGAEALVERMAP